MAIEAEVLQDTTTVAAKNALDVQGSDVAVVTDNGVKGVEATSNTYVINSGGMYSGNMSGNIPTWLDQAVTTAIADGTVTLSQALSDLDVYVRNMETGVNQSIVSLQDKDTTMNTLITTNKSESDTALAAIGQTLTTKITATDATAISQNVLAAEFSDPNSYITNSAWYVNNVKTYADATSGNTTSLDAMATVVTDPVTGVTATADNIKTGYTTVGLNPDGTLSANAGNAELMTAVVGPIEARLTTTEGVSAGYFHVWDGTEAVKIGMIHTTADGTVYQYYGGSWNEGYQIGWKRLDKAANDAASAVATNVTVLEADLQNQIDNKSVSYFSTTAPYSAASGTSAQDGDTWFNTSTNLLYRFNYSATAWEQVTDQQIVDANTAASSAQGTADGKRTVYYLATPPTTSVQIGDMNVNPTTKVVTMWNGNAWIDTTNTTANQAHGWAGGASKLITDPNTGAVTGWGFADGTGVQSAFTINADTFKVQGTASGYTPFAIDTVTGKIKFTGDVTFAGLGIDGNSTSIDGSKITTGKIQSADTSTYFDLANNRIKMHNTTGLGFTLDSTALGTSTDPNIQGGYIKGTTIEGATIDATSTIQADHVYVKSIIPGNLCAPIVFITNTRGVSGTTNVSVATPSKILYSPSYSTGILANRVKSTSTIISGVAAIFGSTGLTKSNTAVYLQSSPDGASWTTIASAGGVSTSIISSDITIDTTNNVYLRVYGVSNSDGNWKGPTSAYVKMEYHILN